jgi:hypothetical protein
MPGPFGRSGVEGGIISAPLPLGMARTRSSPSSPSCAPRVNKTSGGAAASPQLLQQRLCLSQIGRMEPLGEPAVNRGEEIAGLGAAALFAP